MFPNSTSSSTPNKRLNIYTEEGRRLIKERAARNKAAYQERFQRMTTASSLLGDNQDTFTPFSTPDINTPTKTPVEGSENAAEAQADSEKATQTEQPSLYRTSTFQSHNSTSSSQSSVRTESFIGEDIPLGEFNTYDDFKMARLKKRFTVFQISSAAVLGIVGVAFPPALAAAGSVYALTSPAIWKGLGYVFTLATELAGNPTALPEFKKKVKSTADDVSRSVSRLKDFFRENKRFQVHEVFLDRLANSLQEFARKIENQNLEECLAETLRFEDKALAEIRNHLLNCETQKNKENNVKNINKVQDFVRSYNKYLNELPENLADIEHYNRIKLQYLVDRARESGIPILREWSQNPQNLAFNLARLRVVNQNN